MTRLSRILHPRWTGGERPRQFEARLDSELRFHFDEQVAANLRKGMSEAEARRATRLEFGGIEQIKEECRDARRISFLHLAVQDVSYALRGMGRSPGFTAVAVMTLAVAIGINTGVFTVAGTLLFGGYPQVDPDNRILYSPVGLISTAEFQDWKAQTKSFSGMAGVEDGGMRLVFQDDSGNSETCDTTQLTTNAFQVLNQRPVIGRDFVPSDGVPGAPSVALLNYAFWERRFGKDPSVIGKSFRLDDKPVTVIGVMPPGFTFPTPRVDLWIQIVPRPCPCSSGSPSAVWRKERLVKALRRNWISSHAGWKALIRQTRIFIPVCRVSESSFLA